MILFFYLSDITIILRKIQRFLRITVKIEIIFELKKFLNLVFILEKIF